MKIKFYFVWLICYAAVLSQNLIRIYPASLNEYRWVPWEVSGSYMFRFSNGKIGNCTLSGYCMINTYPNYNVTSYLIRNQYTFALDYRTNTIKRKNIFSESLLVSYNLPKNYIKGLYSTAVTDNNFYQYQKVEDVERLGIYTNTWYATIPLFYNFLEDMSTRWYIENDGLYSFDIKEKGIFFVKRKSELFGNTLE
jgi:hypothetical protein